MSRFISKKALFAIGLTLLHLSASIAYASETKIVGKIPDNITVNNRGTAVYHIPLRLPAGIAGFQPELSISYDSGAGNGLLGMGFDLGGLSSIRRTATTIEQDGFIDGVDFDANDRFNMDGQRLVCVAGTYGSDASEYRTEIESFARITAHGSSGSGPDYFVVETKSGLTKTYGQSANTAHLYNKSGDSTDGSKVVWLLEKVEDSSGNLIHYTYTGDSGSARLYLSEITYGAAQHLLKAAMIYEDRDDHLPEFIKGNNYATTKRLKAIEIDSGSNHLVSYECAYDYSPHRPVSRLRELIYRDEPTQELMRSSFDWLDESTSGVGGFESKEDWLDYTGSDLLEVTVTEQHIASEERTIRRDLIDIDGDGRPDRVEYRNHQQSGTPGMWIHLNNGDGFDTPTLWYQSAREEQNCIQWKYDGISITAPTEMSQRVVQMKSMLFDMNGDGLLDKVDHMDYSTVDTPGIWVSINNGSGFDPKANWLPSAVLEEHAYLFHREDTGTRRDLTDINGDGLPDRVEYENHELNDAPGMWVRLNTGTGFATAALWFQGAVEQQNYTSWDFPAFTYDDHGTLFNTLIDLNGDRVPEKIDYIDPTSATTLGMWVSPGTGAGFGSAIDWLQVAITPVPFGTAIDHSAARSVQKLVDQQIVQADLIDMNGDGLPDRITMQHPVTGILGSWVALNHGSGFDAFTLWAPDGNDDSYANALNATEWNRDWGTKARMLDMNGDGLPDKVMGVHPDDNSAGVWVMLNNGAGFETPVDWFQLRSEPYNQSSLKLYARGGGLNQGVCRDLIDVNGDGLPDRVDYLNFYESNAGYGFWVYINNGRGFEPPVDWYEFFKFKFDNLSQFFVERSNVSYFSTIGGTPILDEQHGTVYAKLMDINGDGFPDRVTGEEFDHDGLGMWVGLSQMKPTKLITITDNLGAVTEIEYKPLTDPSVYTVGVRDQTPPIISVLDTRYVVSALSRDNGLPSPAQTSYTYAEGRMHMDGRGFLGFRVFESYDHQTYLTHTEILRQDFPYTGMTESKAVYASGGQMIARTTNTLNLKGTNPYVVNENGQDVTYYHTVFPYAETTESWTADFDDTPDFSTYTEAQLIAHLETTAHQHITTDYDYDAHGNQISELVDYGEGYSRETTTLYAYDNVAAWFLGRASDITVRSNAPGQTEEVRSSSFTYNSAGLLWTETVEPGNPLSVTTTYTRDTQGRITSVTVDPADGPAVVRESHSQPDATGRFYEKRSNALGHSETTLYDSGWGWVLNQTDTNSRVTSFQYDPLGRPARIDYPDGSWREYSFAFDTTRLVDPNETPPGSLALQSAYTLTESGPQVPSQKVWYDRTGKEITTASESFDGRWAYTDYYQNFQGNEIRNSLPYYDGDTVLWNWVIYDALRRPFIEWRPTGLIKFKHYTGRLVKQETLQGDLTGAPLKTERIRTNARGETISTSAEDDGGSELILSYTYDAVGNLIETVDSEGNTISMSYDIRGNKTGMDDPDMGLWTYNYNALGQLVSQTDAVGNVTTKTYDVLGRVTQETFTTPASQVTTHEFYYDGDGEFEEIGTLRYEKSSNGTSRAHYYDDLGRKFLTLEQIEGRWFYRQQDYDAYSRPTRLTHYWRPPSLDDGQHPHHLAWYSYAQETIYNSYGFPSEVKDDQGQTWWSSPEYTASGQLLSYLSANGLRTTNSYDPASLERVRTVVDNGIGDLIDQSYDYNVLGHLTQRGDQLRGLTEVLTYDSLQRLDTVSLGGTQTLDMAYDDLGNITSRSDISGAYSYAGATGPHRVTSAGGRSFAYDANGAITSVSGSSAGLITWNAFHKPTAIEVNGQQSTFTYGTAKQRVAQTRLQWDSVSSQWATKSRKTYVGSLFEQEQVWPDGSTGDPADPASWEIASTRIYIATPAGVTGSWTRGYQSGTLERTCFHRDHLGSVIAESGADMNDPATYAQLIQEFSYDAWGRARSATDWSTAETPDREGTDRGYTGHEMLDKLGLVHMNGRIYDPILARFLSADPFIQAPENQQSYNRYSYVWNNPLSMTDPSGFIAEDGGDSAPAGDSERGGDAIQSEKLSSNSGQERQTGEAKSASAADEIGAEAKTDQIKNNQKVAANQAQNRSRQENGDRDSNLPDAGELKDFSVVDENPNFASGTEVYELVYLRDFIVTGGSLHPSAYLNSNSRGARTRAQRGGGIGTGKWKAHTLHGLRNQQFWAGVRSKFWGGVNWRLNQPDIHFIEGAGELFVDGSIKFDGGLGTTVWMGHTWKRGGYLSWDFRNFDFSLKSLNLDSGFYRTRDLSLGYEAEGLSFNMAFSNSPNVSGGEFIGSFGNTKASVGLGWAGGNVSSINFGVSAVPLPSGKISYSATEKIE